MGQILSNSEVEAILSALDFTSPQQGNLETRGPETSEEVTLYDFEHPEPLRRAQLDALQIKSASVCPSLQVGLSSVLHSTAVVNFLGIEQSTFCDFLATSERPGCFAVVESAASPLLCLAASPLLYLLDITRSLAFSLMSCQLGGDPSAPHIPSTMSRPFTELESRLIQKAIQTLLPHLGVGGSPGDSWRVTKLLSDAALLSESKSNEAVALVSYEIVYGSNRGLMQLCIPWKQVAYSSSISRDDPAQFREILRSASVKLPVTATARIAAFQLSTRDLATLNPGDVVLTDTLATGEVSLEVGGQEIFRGTPGQCDDRKVIRLTGTAGSHASKTGSE